MKGFDDAFCFVVGAEGGYTNDPHDRGNWTTGIIGEGELRGTKFGISAMSYPAIDIASMSLDEAKRIYRADYWQPMRCDYVAYPKAVCLFDCAVNQGHSRAAKFAQRASGVPDDGIMGPITVAAINRMPDNMFVEYFLQSRKSHYESLPTFERYGKGWLARLEHVRAEAGYA